MKDLLKKGFATLLILMSGSVSIAQTTITTQDSLDLCNIWQTFRLGMTTEKKKSLAAMSLKRIYCSDCYDNTVEEKQRIETMQQNDEQKWLQLLNSLYFVPIQKWVEEDAPIIANSIGKAALLSKYTLVDESNNAAVYLPNSPNAPVYGILITIAAPNHEYDGLQGLFSFVKTKKGFKFCAYGTIP